MYIRKARALLFLAGALLYPLQTAALTSGGPDYSNARSSPASAGHRKTSTDYRLDGEAGGMCVPTAASTDYLIRDGLMGIEYYPGRATGVWGSTGTALGSVYLQWIAPGNDGYENSTAGAFIVRYSSIAANSPALSDANFNAAANVPAKSQ